MDGVEQDVYKTKDDSLVVIHGPYHGDFYSKVVVNLIVTYINGQTQNYTCDNSTYVTQCFLQWYAERIECEI